MMSYRLDTTVLGIDAAWSAGGGSGGAVLCRDGDGAPWRCAGVAPGYAAFAALARGESVDWHRRPGGGEAAVPVLLDAAARLTGERPRVVAVDMPLARSPITGRRAADDRTASAFVGTHSPSAERPGAVGTALHRALAAHGHVLATADGARPASALLEVYPHAAAMRLLGLPRGRVHPYKSGRTRTYWPRADAAERRERILASQHALLKALCGVVAGLPDQLPLPDTPVPFARLKPFEDALDAVLCAWVAACYVEHRADAHGDPAAAVWVPAAEAVPPGLHGC